MAAMKFVAEHRAKDPAKAGQRLTQFVGDRHCHVPHRVIPRQIIEVLRVALMFLFGLDVLRHIVKQQK